MSSPSGPQYSQENLLARWMPNSSRAGVILHPSLDLAQSFRQGLSQGPGAEPGHPDDSFTSHFAPLPASTNSSCLSIDALVQEECRAELRELNQQLGGERTVSDRLMNGLYSAPGRNSIGELDTLEELASKSQDLSLVMKLEQLRQWQQHMQEQLKAHQLEELLRLQEEQQRLLGMMSGSQHCGSDFTEISGLSGTGWGQSTLQRASPHTEAPHSPTVNGHGVPQGSPCGSRQEPKSPQAGRRGPPQTGRDQEEVEDQAEVTDAWSSSEDQEQSLDASRYPQHGATSAPLSAEAMTEDPHRGEGDAPQDRPIKPGIGGRQQTFEELLEEQLRLEEQRLKTSQQQSRDGAGAAGAPPKRAFLKRGEGLSRFTNNRKAPLPDREAKKDPKLQPQGRAVCRSTSEPAALRRASASSSQRLPVHRKTAVLNKENRPRGSCSPPQDVRADGKATRAKVLGSHQRQNTGGVESTQTDSEGGRQWQPGPAKEQRSRTVGAAAQTTRKPGTRDVHPNAVTKQLGVAAGGLGKAEKNADRESRCGSRRISAGGRPGSEEEEERGGGVVPEYSFELSFQERLRRWDSDRRKDSVELGEFELLEQAADELSFSSNSSFVMKVLQMDRQHRELQASTGRRLSSTPIKSPRSSPPTAPQRCSGSSSGGSSVTTCKSNSSDPDASVPKSRGDTLTNKVPDEDDGRDDGGEGKQETSDVSFCSSSEFSDQEAAGKPPTFPSSLRFPAPMNPPYDKRSYQDRDRDQDGQGETVSDATDGDDDSVLADPDDSTLMEDEDGQRSRLVFDDDDTWNDPEDPGGLASDGSRRASVLSKATANEISPPEKVLTRKVVVTKGAERDKGVVIGSANQEKDVPLPASQLMTRLFPSLKPKAQTVPPPPAPPPPAPEPRKAEEAPGQQVQSRQLRERLVELEIEIEHFKKENAALTRLRQENERNQENLRKERVEFEQRKEEELARFEEYRKEESRRLQRERKVFEKHASAVRAMPDKKEREEIQALKQQLTSLQEELRRRESRWSTTHGRLRQQISSLNAENSALRDEVNTLEKLRLSAWRKSPSGGEKDRETREGARMFESSGPSSTKGVKFASPLDTRGTSPPQSGSAPASRDNGVGATAGMKSSLRRPASSSSSSAPGRSTEEKPSSATRSQENPLNQELPHPLSPIDCLQTEAEPTDSQETESNQEVITHPDGKTEQVLPCGGRLVVFPNGTRKEVSADGLTAKVTFFNGDTKQVLADQRVIYYYAEAQTTHTTYPDGMEVLQFPNNQTEKHFPDGRKEITFPDQTVKNLYPDGREESVLTDGTIIQVNPDGSKEIQFNTGQKEIHTADYKRREYPDGTVKTVYTDGRQETRYPTGRVRIKDKDGNIVMDNKL